MSQTNAADAERLALAESWIAQDPDPETRAELSALVEGARAGDAAASAELADRFDTRLAFGTAGLRGEIAAGPNRMNRVLVAQAAAGLAAYLLERARPGETPSVVIGYDGRKNSAVFARDSAEVMAGAGVRAVLLPQLLPTPVLAFAVRHLDMSAGVMVTASHNPPNDNGYKVYLGGDDHGSQIVAPADAEIAAAILRVAAIDDRARTAARRLRDRARVGRRRVHPPDRARRRRPGRAAPRRVHGDARRRLGDRRAGARRGRVRRPRARRGADLARSRVPHGRVPEPRGARGDGPELRARARGRRRADHRQRPRCRSPRDRRSPMRRRPTGTVASPATRWGSCWAGRPRVAPPPPPRATPGPTARWRARSSPPPGCEAVARAYDLDFEATLTGFKWISRATGLVFGFEEALGYLVNPGTVRDKDGISAAVAFLSLAAELKAAGRTISDHLDEFVERFGCYASSQISLRVTDLSRIGEIMARLRAEPPASVGGIRVERIEDLADGFGALPPSDVLRILLEGGGRVMVRPSGTEPKLKVYIDAVGAEGTVAERRAAASDAVAALEAGMRELTA